MRAEKSKRPIIVCGFSGKESPLRTHPILATSSFLPVGSLLETYVSSLAWSEETQRICKSEEKGNPGVTRFASVTVRKKIFIEFKFSDIFFVFCRLCL